MPPNNTQKTKNQNGNIFIVIMLGIFLFGALMYAFSRGASQGTGNLTKQQAKIAAQEILNYARLVEGAVDRVRRNGCSESEISFDNAVVTGYSNPNSPVDLSCHIFEDEGGKVSYISPPSNTTSLDWFFDSGVYVGGIGEETALSGADLIILLPDISKTICENINSILDHDFSSTPIDNGNIFENADDKYIGTFISGAESDILTGHSSDDDCTPVQPLCMKETGCFQEESGNEYYIFYHVLLAR